MAFVILTVVVCGGFLNGNLFMENIYFIPFAFEVYDFQEGGNFLERITENLEHEKTTIDITDYRSGGV